MSQTAARPKDKELWDVMFALGLMRDSLTEWSKTPTFADFTPPEFIPQLQDRCSRIVELLGTEEISSYALDERLPWFSAATRINQNVEKADDARQQFLHPRATEYRRKQNMLLVNYYLEDAYKAAKRLADELERYRLLRRGGPKKEEPNAACIRALQRSLQQLSDPEHWCKDFEAKDNQGRRVHWNNGHAYSFSIVGALQAAAQFLEPDQQRDAIEFVGHAAKCRSTSELQEWNDKLSTTHRDVIKTINVAIKFLEKNDRKWQYKFEL